MQSLILFFEEIIIILFVYDFDVSLSSNERFQGHLKLFSPCQDHSRKNRNRLTYFLFCVMAYLFLK